MTCAYDNSADMIVKTLLLLVSLWTSSSRANSAISSFRVNISESDLIHIVDPGRAIDGSGQSCPSDNDTFNFFDPGWFDQSSSSSNSLIQRYSQSDYLISSGESTTFSPNLLKRELGGSEARNGSPYFCLIISRRVNQVEEKNGKGSF